MKANPQKKQTKRVNLPGLFRSIAKEMRESFATFSNVSHGPSKGRGEEQNWIEWFKKYLPKRYSVGSGFITDSKGNQSLQQDIIIYDRQYSPLLLVKDDLLFIPSECVYAVLEVKTVLNAEEMRDAIKKGVSVKSLFRQPAQDVVHAGGIFPRKDRGQIYTYVLALRANWSSKRIWKSVERLLCKSPDQIDGGCILERGAFSLNCDNVNGRRVEKIGNRDQALISFFGLLLEDIKTLGTTAPWDLGAYSESVKRLRSLRLQKTIEVKAKKRSLPDE